MPSGTHGRGGDNCAKKPKFPVLALSDSSTKSSNLKSNEKVSLLKKIVHAMPGSGSQSNKSQSRGTSTGSQLHPRRDISPRHTNTIPRQPRGGCNTLPARPKTSPGAFPPTAPSRVSFADDASHPSVVDITHRNRNRDRNGTPAINLNTLTPSSSEDECSDSEPSMRPLSPKEILPFTSRQRSTDNKGTVVNEGPFSSPPEVPFSSSPEVPCTFKAPLTATGNRVRVRSSSLNDGFLRRIMSPSQPQPQPQPDREVEDLNRNGDQKKALAALEGNLGCSPTGEGKGNPNHRPVINDKNYKRDHRMTLATPVTTISRIPPSPSLPPARRPISELSSFTDLLPATLNEHTHRWSEIITSISGPGAAPPSDPFNHLFTSCVISLILLIILAAGKDILYVIALLPVLVTLAKHFLDLNQFGLYTPFMRKSLESLLSI